jgi:hypothetical protein
VVLLEIRARFRLSEEVIIDNVNDLNSTNEIKFTRNKEIDLATLFRILSSEKINNMLRSKIKTGNEPVNLLFHIIDNEIEVFNQARAINELEIKIKATNPKNGIEIATKKAKLICNLLTLKTQKPVVPIYRGCSISEEDKSRVIGIASFRVIDEPKIDLFKEEISNVDVRFVESLEHYSKGLIANRNNFDPATAIKEFHQIIEDHKSDKHFKHLIKYDPLRHVLSHGEPIHKHTLEKLWNLFPDDNFLFTESGKFDYSSEQNMLRLSYHAKFLEMELHNLLVDSRIPE